MQELIPQACERCRVRKQKCDRVKPKCGQCRQASTPCIERRLGNLLDPDNPEAHHSYIESMKRRISNLESRLNSAASLPLTSSISGQGGDGTEIQSLAANAHHDTLQTEIGFLSLTAMAGFTGDPILHTSNISFNKLVQASTSVSGSDILQSQGQNEAVVGQLGDFHRTLLRKGISLSMTEPTNAMHRVLVLLQHSLPLINGPQLSDDYNEVMRSEEQGRLEKTATESPCKVIRVYLAAAIGMLMGRGHRQTESFATLFILTAYQFMPRVFAQANDREAAQCLTLMAVLAMYTPFGGSAWHLLGLAMTRCIAGGMHTARMSDHRSHDEGQKSSSRIFWTIYTLDAILSASSGRPFNIQDEDITSARPSRSREQTDRLDELHAWNVHQAKLLHDIRAYPGKGTLYHFSNYQHWKETAPLAMASIDNEDDRSFHNYHFHSSACRVLLAIVCICEANRGGLESSMIMTQATQDFEQYFEALERHATTNDCTITSVDGLEVFSTAVGLIWVTYHRATSNGSLVGVDRQVLVLTQKPLQLLTRVSGVFSAFTVFRDILQNFTNSITSESVVFDYSTISQNGDFSIPVPAQTLMVQALEMKRNLS
uniref:Zn(2)-C6 fungal-type domain-containing protein n=2 Tax=Bionectria ochroleuca TaxID=29856 RepID=A0A0B7K8J1_BIOOC